MTFVCVICEEFLTVEMKDGIPFPIITTRCGHVFHQKCLLDWFEAKRKNNAQEVNHGLILDSSEKCPSCQNDTNAEQLIRIYPTEEREDGTPGSLPGGEGITELKTKAELLSELREEQEVSKMLRRKYQELENEGIDKCFQRLELDENVAMSLDKPKQGTSKTAKPYTPPTPKEIIRTSRLSVKHLWNTDGGLEIGDNVVWLSPEENYEGIVLWIGTVNKDVFAAVLFKDPIGNTNGVMNDKVIFNCSPEFTRLIRVSELILQGDFHANKSITEIQQSTTNSAVTLPIIETKAEQELMITKNTVY